MAYLKQCIPTLIIGLGGTGVRIVELLREKSKKSAMYADLIDEAFVFSVV